MRGLVVIWVIHHRGTLALIRPSELYFISNTCCHHLASIIYSTVTPWHRSILLEDPTNYLLINCQYPLPVFSFFSSFFNIDVKIKDCWNKSGTSTNKLCSQTIFHNNGNLHWTNTPDIFLSSGLTGLGGDWDPHVRSFITRYSDRRCPVLLSAAQCSVKHLSSLAWKSSTLYLVVKFISVWATNT